MKARPVPRLADAVKPAAPAARHGRHGPPQGSVSEQQREAAESAHAHEASASVRDRMVAIGRGNQQAGRQLGGRAK